jgi:hypothetical protein
MHRYAEAMRYAIESGLMDSRAAPGAMPISA